MSAYKGVMYISAPRAIRLAKAPTLVVQSDPDERVAAIYAAHYQRLVGLAMMLGEAGEGSARRSPKTPS